MSRHSSVPLVVCIVLASLDVSATVAADMPANPENNSERWTRDRNPSSIADKNCGHVIYEYRSQPKYTDIKTVCSGPWTPPSTSDY